jgi:uncharacterized protein YjbJ (UPF0337 family)
VDQTKLAVKTRKLPGVVSLDKELENGLEVDQAEGAIRNKVGNTKDAGMEAADSVNNAPSRR